MSFLSVFNFSGFKVTNKSMRTGRKHHHMMVSSAVVVVAACKCAEDECPASDNVQGLPEDVSAQQTMVNETNKMYRSSTLFN